MTIERFLLLAPLAIAIAAHADPVHFRTNSPDGAMAMASGATAQAADDFVLAEPSRITHASFTGIIPATSTPSDITGVAVEIYRVFPFDSVDPPSGHVPTRTGSPSDDAFDSRQSASSGLTYAVSIINPAFNAANSVQLGIHPVPNQTTGGEGPVSGQEIVCDLTFVSPIELPAGHYFFVPRVSIPGADFYWLSAPRPIVAPGTPFVGDLQAWIRNGSLSPDWLRVGGDIVSGGHAFNATFSLDGDTDVVFRDGFDPIAG
jgi:hypothetical protein